MKPYYQDSLVTLYHGDCRDVLPSISGVQLVVTDPPYNCINRPTNGLRAIDKGGADSLPVDIRLTARWLTGTGAKTIYSWCGHLQFSDWQRALQAEGFSTRTGVWWKINPSPMNGDDLWLSAVELCAFGRRRGAVFNVPCGHPVWRGPIDQTSPHPTPKPEWLVGLQIRASSNPGDTVLDAFCGAGPVLRMAKDMGRRAIGIEIEERYCEIAARRCSQEVLELGA